MQIPESYRRTFLTILVVIITVAFVLVMRRFLVTVMLAAVFTAMVFPVYRRVRVLFRGRTKLAAATTMLLLILVVILPCVAFVGVLVKQAVEISSGAGPMIQERFAQRGEWSERLSGLPFAEKILPYREEALQKGAEAAAAIGRFAVGKLSDVTRGTVSFILQLVLMLYAMFFFLMDGKNLMRSIGAQLPLSPEDRTRLVERFLSVSRATLTSTVVIGALQGTLGGVGFAVAGIPAAVFWGTVMTVLAMIPGIGTALVWIPAAVYLAVTRGAVATVVFALYFVLVVGMVDNLLRPRLVGRGTQMHELLVLLATLGGIMVFGIVGFILGPVIAALFITLWEIQGAAMREDAGRRG
jgi:predicted PurR-regulated permease PerM